MDESSLNEAEREFLASGRQALEARQQARQRMEEGGLPAALENLRYKAGTIFDCEPAGDRLYNDWEFRRLHPEHPEADPQRFIRTDAIDFIHRKAQSEPAALGEDVRTALHVALFDRCASVRHMTARTSGLLGHPATIPHLRRLLREEPESQMTKDEVAKALERCGGG